MNSPFDICKSHIPNAMLNMYKIALLQHDKVYPDDELRTMIAKIILGNPICSCCLRKDNNTLQSLRLCGNCCLDFYCSADCMLNHFPIHRKYCNNINGEWPTNSPFAPAIVNTKKYK